MQDTTQNAPTDVALEMASELQTWRTRVLNALLAVISIAAAPVIVSVIVEAVQSPEQWPAVSIFAAIYLFIVGLAVFRRLDPRLRAWGLLLLGYAAGALAFARGGLAGDGPMYLLALPVLATILVDVRSGLIMAVLGLLTFAAFTVTVYLGWLANWLTRLDNPLTLASWMSKGTTFAMLLIALVVLQWLFSRSQASALRTARERATELSETHALLQERAEELDQRAVQLAMLNRIGRHVASILDRQELLQHAVDAVREDMGYLQAAVLLVDEEANALYVVAATDNLWKVIPDGYRQPVGEGLIGVAAETGETVLVNDVYSDSRAYRAGEWFSPSSLSAPIKIGRRVLGVLHVEGDAPNAFDENDQVGLETMADQLAIAVENARLFSESQANLRELNALYRQYVAEAWRGYAQAKPDSMRYSHGSVTCPAQTWQAACEQARTSGEAVTFAGDDGGDGTTQSLAMPVSLRGLSIGVLGFHRPAGTGAWRPEEITMVRMLADRLALAVENIRLLEDTQRRAEQEQTLSEITARFSRSLDVDGLLRSAVRELGRVLPVEEVSVHVGPSGMPSPAESEKIDRV
ncbi:MAG: GAF domain-containing protein [Chloroflexota bacterium]|nr:GAF domain-containing protein [Chloroflexota bacterium]